MKKVNMVVVVVIPLVVMAVIVGAVFAYKYLGQPSATTKAAAPTNASVQYNPYNEMEKASGGGGLNAMTATESVSVGDNTDLNAELQETLDDGGKSDLDAIVNEAATL